MNNARAANRCNLHKNTNWNREIKEAGVGIILLGWFFFAVCWKLNKSAFSTFFRFHRNKAGVKFKLQFRRASLRYDIVILLVVVVWSSYLTHPALNEVLKANKWDLFRLLLRAATLGGLFTSAFSACRALPLMRYYHVSFFLLLREGNGDVVQMYQNRKFSQIN